MKECNDYVLTYMVHLVRGTVDYYVAPNIMNPVLYCTDMPLLQRNMYYFLFVFYLLVPRVLARRFFSVLVLFLISAGLVVLASLETLLEHHCSCDKSKIYMHSCKYLIAIYLALASNSMSIRVYAYRTHF